MAAGDMEQHIERVLWSEQERGNRVSKLAPQISRDFTPLLCSSSSPLPVVVSVATGTFLFLADLVRRISLPLSVDFVRADSYGSGTLSSGAPKISFDLKLDVRGRHAILVASLSLSFCV